MTPNPLTRARSAMSRLLDAAVTLTQLRYYAVTSPDLVTPDRLARAQALARERLASVRGDLAEVEAVIDDAPETREGDGDERS